MAPGEGVQTYWRNRRVGGEAAEQIGTAVRTRTGVKPVFVSPGHRCAHEDGLRLVLDCTAGYRLPEPVRLADRLVARFKRIGRYRGGMACAEDVH